MTESPTSDPTVVPWVSVSLRRYGDPSLDVHGVIFRSLLVLRLSSLLQPYLLSDRIVEFRADPHWPEPLVTTRMGLRTTEKSPEDDVTWEREQKRGAGSWG